MVASGPVYPASVGAADAGFDAGAEAAALAVAALEGVVDAVVPPHAAATRARTASSVSSGAVRRASSGAVIGHASRASSSVGGRAAQPGREPLGFGLDHRVGQAPGIVQGQVALDDRVGHHRVADGRAIVVEGGPDRQALHVHRPADVGRQVQRQRAHRDRVDAERVDQRGDLDARVGIEVGDQRAVVHRVDDDPGGHAGRHRLGDRRGVLTAPLDLERLAGVEHPAGLRVLLEVVRHAVEVLADRDVEPLDGVAVRVALADVPRVVLRVVLGRLGRVRAQAAEQLGADEVVLRRLPRVDEGAQRREEVDAVVLEPEDERVVVEPGRLRLDALVRQAEIAPPAGRRSSRPSGTARRP